MRAQELLFTDPLGNGINQLWITPTALGARSTSTGTGRPATGRAIRTPAGREPVGAATRRRP